MNMRGTEEGNINQYLADTIASVFSEIYTVDVSGSTNRELFASNHSDMMKTFSKNVEMETDEELIAMMELVESHLSPYEAGDYVMTDDKAPVELLGMQVIDEVIQNEVRYYQKIYEEKGIEGLLDSF